MASVKLPKSRESKFWVMCITLPDGSRKQLSSHSKDKEKSLQMAIALEKAGKEARETRLSERKARNVLQQIALITGGDVLTDETAREFFSRYVKIKKHTTSTRTHQRIGQVFGSFLKFLGVRADEPLAFLERRDVSQWRDQELERGLSPVSVNTLLTFLTTAFKQARIEGLTTEILTEGIRVPRASKSAQTRLPFTVEQFRELIDATEGEWQTLIMIAGFTGQRKEDCVTLRWKQVDFERRLINFERSKTNDTLEVPMHIALEKRLRAVFRADPKGHIMPDMASLPKTGRISVSDVFRNQILPRIGVVQRYGGKSGAGRKLAPYSFHSLRHSFTTWLNAAGVSDADRMKIVGHDDKRISRQYTHSELEAARKAVGQLPGI